MAKIYVFGIGGTGSRVLRAMTMMLAAGVDFGTNEIVPIIVDPDAGNADFNRTKILLNKYSTIRNQLTFTNGNKNKFFKTEIRGLKPDYTLSLAGTNDMTFQNFINLAGMPSAENKAIVKMLFSDKNLESSMNVGFKGNPNVGSVVLNQFVDSPDFVAFANDFAQDDSIFIISSIFGGTGASGFPLLYKTLRTCKTLPNGTQLPNFNLINTAKIGALTILPYFKLTKNPKSGVDSSTFISKTKSALAYYEKNISQAGSDKIDALYFLADDLMNTYPNNDGGPTQQNAAHLIEFFGATAIENFSKSNFTNNSATVNREFGINNIGNAAGTVSFNDIPAPLHDTLYSPMTQFTLMANALTHKVGYYSSPSFNANKAFNNFYSGQFFGDLSWFLNAYLEWLGEMKGNCRSLDLFNLGCGDMPFDLVTGVKPKKVISHLSNYNLITDRLNSALKGCSSKASADKFLEMFFLGTEKLVKEKLQK